MPFIKHDPLKEYKYCTHPEHFPPKLIYLPPGTHVYQCPACGKTQTIIVPEVRL